MPTLVVILGPTGVGKTDESLRLARLYGCPIVSADSRQIYRDLPIGTAAPTSGEQQAVRHYFVGCKDLTETYNAGQYARDCLELLSELFLTHDRVIMVGGSMMYVDAVCRGLDDIPEVPVAVRNAVRADYQQNGLEWLQAEVARLDPVYWAEVDTQNPQRLMHCVEVCRVSGQPYSAFRRNGKPNRQSPTDRGFDIEEVMIERPRAELYDRINRRVDRMLEMGLLDEAKRAFGILNIPLTPLPEGTEEVLPNSVNTVGYKELLRYFRGEWTLDRAVEMIKQNSRHYAKRQMTWWRNKQKTI